MIRLFEKLSAPGSIEDAYSKARQQAERGRWGDALETLLASLLVSHAREQSYSAAVMLLTDALERAGEHRAALSAAWYTGDVSHQTKLLERVPAVDRARTFMSWAEADASQRAKHFKRAAGELEQAGQLARAAVCNERANDVNAARALWSRLAQLVDSARSDRYAAGLCRFNLARMCRLANDARGAREATMAAVHRLEEAADRFESMGQRERAFDCYHVLIEIGSATDTFEHVLEGCVNAIRVLTEDNLRYHALRLYEHAIKLASFAGEHSAAATLCREMTDYARRQGLHRVASRGTLTQAELWASVAEQTAKRQGPTNLVENALVAGLLAQAEAGQYTKVGQIYSQLAALDVESSRREHYARAAKRYTDARDTPIDASLRDERLGEHVGPPDVWHVDLLEWEARGSASEACANVLLDPSEDSDRITRRTALVARLAALGAENAPPGQAAKAQSIVAEQLAPIGLYGVLSPLETLYGSDLPGVRLAAVRALSRYYYKRTFITLERALVDPDPGVVKEAVAALERLRFDHAFDPLSRIYRSSTRLDARLAALRSIARIDALEAAELVLGVLEHGGPEERQVVADALKAGRGNRFVEVARAAFPDASRELKATLSDVLRARGLSL
ncbi:MAG: HEAT repeat domain-containing protein [Myxococcales bacterium]|nr:HEAT repeat domain-containing protein [Myxococcales bacterium]